MVSIINLECPWILWLLWCFAMPCFWVRFNLSWKKLWLLWWFSEQTKLPKPGMTDGGDHDDNNFYLFLSSSWKFVCSHENDIFVKYLNLWKQTKLSEYYLLHQYMSSFAAICWNGIVQQHYHRLRFFAWVVNYFWDNTSVRRCAILLNVNYINKGYDAYTTQSVVASCCMQSN